MFARSSIVIEPWRAATQSVNRDLVADHSADDKILQAGRFVLGNTGGAPDTNLRPVPKARANAKFEAATCIVHSVCGASCKNASAQLFDAAELRHLHSLPQHQQQRYTRERSTVDEVNAEGLGICTQTLDCEDLCRMETSVEFLSKLNVDTNGAVPKEA